MASSSLKLSLILLCTIFFFSTTYALNISSSTTDTSSLDTKISAIKNFCHGTPHPDACFNSLKLSISINISPKIIDYLLQTLQFAISEAGKLTNLFLSSNIVEKQRGTIQDCIELHQITLSSLQGSVSKIRESDSRKLADARAYLSAALTNKITCLEGLDSASGSLKPTLVNSLIATYMHVSNSLSILSRPNPSPSPKKATNKNRRLLGLFPKWLSRKDRRILQTSAEEYDPTDVLTVAADGTGNFSTITDAINFAPTNSYDRIIIYVKEGVYEENVEIPTGKTNIVLVGDGSNLTVITGNRSVGDNWTTFRSATLAVSGDGFLARDLTVENSAGPEKHQAVALRDFDHIQERRRMERERKFRKRVTIGAISAFVLVVMIAAGVFAAVTIPKNNKLDKPKEVSKVGKLIATVCNVTEYKNSCNDTLTKAVHQHPTSLEPRQFLKYAMAAASEEAGKAFDKINGLKFDDPKEQTAWEYCKELAEQAKGEFDRSLGGVVLKESFGLRNLTSRASDLKSWLSAVISYGEMCSDAFPEGQKRTDMEKLWTVTRHLTDNSLALVTQFTNYISSMDLRDQQTGRRLLQETNGHSVDNEVPLVTEETNGHSVDDYIPPEWMIQDQLHSGRHLLEEETNGHSVDDYIPPDVVEQTDGHSLDEEGFPAWITAGDRRMLAQPGRSNRPKPNIIVAKDGSGNYKTVSEAIKAVPKQFTGRFVIYVKEGIYDEKVVIPYGMSNITMYGDGSQKSIITGNKGTKDGLLLHQTSTIQILGHRFMAQSIGFRNTAGLSKEQAVAAQVQSDCAIFINCRFEGYRDTLWAATHRQFYKKYNSFKSYIKANWLEEQAYRRRTRKRLIIITLSFIVLIMIITGALVGTLVPMKSTATSKENIPSPTYSS
ncbi:hypothetical protein QYF36_017867 [Acer negundo]|nr:hypothetical protein QYF36_017867 [Acer negundo]